MRTNRYFSLLEIMIGLALVLMAAGVVGWKVQALLEKRRFRVDLEQLRSRILTTHRLAVNMQADWQGILQFDGNHWTFDSICLDSPKSRSFSPIQLHVTDVTFDGKKQRTYTFLFFSSGEIWPAGTLRFGRQNDGQTESWELPAIFGKDEGDGRKKLGPVNPNEA